VKKPLFIFIFTISTVFIHAQSDSLDYSLDSVYHKPTLYFNLTRIAFGEMSAGFQFGNTGRISVVAEAGYQIPYKWGPNLFGEYYWNDYFWLQGPVARLHLNYLYKTRQIRDYQPFITGELFYKTLWQQGTKFSMSDHYSQYYGDHKVDVLGVKLLWGLSYELTDRTLFQWYIGLGYRFRFSRMDEWGDWDNTGIKKTTISGIQNVGSFHLGLVLGFQLCK
jgi:hypothetical protein